MKETNKQFPKLENTPRVRHKNAFYIHVGIAGAVKLLKQVTGGVRQYGARPWSSDSIVRLTQGLQSVLFLFVPLKANNTSDQWEWFHPRLSHLQTFCFCRGLQRSQVRLSRLRCSHQRLGLRPERFLEWHFIRKVNSEGSSRQLILIQDSHISVWLCKNEMCLRI